MIFKSTATPRLERFIIALVVLALEGGAVAVMSFVKLPVENKDVVFQLVGGINTLAGLVVGKYFTRAEPAKEDKENEL